MAGEIMIEKKESGRYRSYFFILYRLTGKLPMRKKIVLLILLMTASFCSLSAKIIEAPHFKNVLQVITPSTLLIVDIDDTLLIPVQTLGTDAWFIYRMKSLQEKGLSQKEALLKAVAEWEAIRQLTAVKIVQEGSEKIIADLQDKELAIMGLTTQGIGLSSCTIRQLKSLHIDLSITAPAGEESLIVDSSHGVLYRKGILFTSGSKKGLALRALFKRIGYQPQHVVFINDKETHLKDVEEDLAEIGVEFIGLRYSHEDKRVAAFNPAIADIQWTQSSFEHILSDEETLLLLNKSEKEKALQ